MRRIAGIVMMMMFCVLVCGAQEIDETMNDSAVRNLSVKAISAVSMDSTLTKGLVNVDTTLAKGLVKADSAMKDSMVVKKVAEAVSKPLYAHFKPDPHISMWLALAIPGAGQIYNRKYWKLPIVYGLGVGIGYAIAYTNRNYQDFRNAYQSYNSSQPNPDLYKPMVPSGYPESSYSNYFKTQMDNYRRSRDISIVAAVIAYALQVIDAFVDAQLSDFDVSPDLSIDVAPEVQQVNNQQAVGVGAKVNF